MTHVQKTLPCAILSAQRWQMADDEYCGTHVAGKLEASQWISGSFDASTVSFTEVHSTYTVYCRDFL